MDKVREAFERTTAQSFSMPNFSTEGSYDYAAAKKVWSRAPSGEYMSPALEDHWQTFQEGWEAAIEFLKAKHVSASSDKYSDIVSTGAKDPR
jgi:hypothetical protein